ncbi:MAG: hypothetical protein ACFFCS_10920 [Candidatus Hodarchaeota archaeon]
MIGKDNVSQINTMKDVMNMDLLLFVPLLPTFSIIGGITFLVILCLIWYFKNRHRLIEAKIRMLKDEIAILEINIAEDVKDPSMIVKRERLLKHVEKLQSKLSK